MLCSSSWPVLAGEEQKLLGWKTVSICLPCPTANRPQMHKVTKRSMVIKTEPGNLTDHILHLRFAIIVNSPPSVDPLVNGLLGWVESVFQAYAVRSETICLRAQVLFRGPKDLRTPLQASLLMIAYMKLENRISFA